MSSILLVSTYELGRQPFGLASPAAWLRRAGMDVTCVDLSREPLPHAVAEQATLIGFHVPMHTASRLAIEAAIGLRARGVRAHIAFYGLYAPLLETALASTADSFLGAEFEEDLVRLARRLADGDVDARPAPRLLPRLRFVPPDRTGLLPLGAYSRLRTADDTRIVGSTEASRGCKHRCRHCPIVPVYDGALRLVQPDVVLEDVRGQVAAGARHVTFADPDFFNAVRHSLAIAGAIHREHPRLTYDVTIKVEHLLEHAALLPVLARTGCLFVTTAVESFDDAVLERLRKGHTRADFVRALAECRRVGLGISPTFIPFTPWTTLRGYLDLLDAIAYLELVEEVAPIQLAIRLLVPPGSLLLELDDVRALARETPGALVHAWDHPDPRVDVLQRAVLECVRDADPETPRSETFHEVRRLAHVAAGHPRGPALLPKYIGGSRAAYLEEPWFC